MNGTLESIGRWTWEQTMLAWHMFSALSPTSLVGIIIAAFAAGKILLQLAQATTRGVRLLCSISSAVMHLCGTTAGLVLFATSMTSRLSWVTGMTPLFHV